MLLVHHLNNSRSQRVLWLLEELGLPYEIRHYKRQKNLRAPPELKAVDPLGKAPILQENDLTLTETGAIVDYIVETHARGRLVPAPGSAAYWQCRHFMHHAEGSAMPPLFMKLVFGEVPKRAPFFARGILKSAMGTLDHALVAPEIAAHLDHWSRALKGSGWFSGADFSVADIMMSFPVEAGASRLDYSRHPVLRDFLARIHARPAFRTALERGGPYAYA
jgi:glutathione S-transferase